MSRIRNIKPEFFSHEELQDMEVEQPGLHPMLVFSGLWTQCEWSGVFSWSARKLKLSILPFLDFNLETTLEYLAAHGFIKKFSREGKDYGYVYNFTRYQAISGHEKENGLKYPLPADEELNGDNTSIVPNQSLASPEPIQGQDRDYTGSPDSDIGHKTKDIDIYSFGFAEKVEPSPESQNPKKPPLSAREPENDYERVEKAYLRNWDELRAADKVKTEKPVVNWKQARALLKRHFLNIKPDLIIQALKSGMADDFILSGAYSLSAMLSAPVLNRLINSGGRRGTGPPPVRFMRGKKSLGGLDTWPKD